MFDFSIDRQRLLSTLMIAVGTIEKKQGLPILSNILVDVSDHCLQINATDTEIELIARIQLEGTITHGTATISAKKLMDICRSLPENASLECHCKENKVLIKSGKSRFSLSTLNPDDFPAVGDLANQYEWLIPKEELERLLRSTCFSMGIQEARHYLNGILLDFTHPYLIAVATDGHRLAISQFKTDASTQVTRAILPRKGALELQRLLANIEEESITIRLSDNHISVHTKMYTLISKLIAERFPNYLKVIPRENDKKVIINRDLLKNALSRVSILSNEKKQRGYIRVRSLFAKTNGL